MIIFAIAIQMTSRRCSVRKGVLRNFAEFTRKTPVPGSLL